MRSLATLALFLTLMTSVAAANTATGVYTINITAVGGYSGPCDLITGGCVAAHSMSQKMVAAYGGHAFELIDSTPAWTGTASISGTTLTVATTTSGAMANGLALSGVGSGFVPAVKPVTYTSGCSGATCTVSQSQTAASVTTAYSVLDVGFEGNGAWDETTWRSFCAGVTCLVEKVFDQGSGGSANDLIASQISGGSATNLDCTASIIVCAPLFVVDTATDTPMAITASSEMGLFGDVYSGNSSSGLPAGATDASVMFSGFNVYASACCGGLYGMMEPNPNSIPNGAMYAVGFANGTGSGGPVNCDAATHIGFWMDVEASSDPPGPCPAAIYDTDQFSRGVWEGQYKSGSNTDTGLWNGSVVWGPITPSEPASARQTWMRIGSGGDRSWLPAAFSDGWLTTDVGSHAIATTKLRNFYAGRSASTCQGPLDFGWYMPTAGLGETGGGVAAPIFTVGIGMGGWSARPLSAWYTGPVITVQNGAGAGSIQTFAGVGCNIDPAITAFCATGCAVNKLFNQAWITAGTTHGNVRQTAEDLSATGSQRPSLTLASLNGQPTIHFSGAQQLCTTATPLGNYHQFYPIDLATVARRTGNFSAVQYAFTSDVSLNLGFYASANTALYQVSSTLTKAATDSQWHSLIGHSASGAGSLYVDNVSSSFSPGTSLFGPTYYCLGGHSGNYLTGDIAEVVMNYTGLFNGTTTYAPQTYANDLGYWQFNGGTIVDSKTFINVGASTTPGSAIPKHVEINLAPGAVPAGMTVTAKVGGSAIPFQLDCAIEGCNTWPDGSLRNAPISMFLPTLAAGASEQVTFSTVSGSPSSGSSVTPATLVAAADPIFYAGSINKTWVNNGLNGMLPPGLAEPGCVVTGGAIASPGGCVLRLTAGTSSGQEGFINAGNACHTNPLAGTSCITGSNNTATVLSSTGTPTVITFTAPAPAGFLRFANIYDLTNPGAISAGTTATATGVGGGGSTITLSTTATVTNGDTIAALYPINGCTGAGFYFTLDGGNVPNAITVPSYGTGSACGVVGTGSSKFDANLFLGYYGTDQPPTCAAAGGAASFNASYSAPTLTVTGGLTGALSAGQVVFNTSTGATGHITAGSGSSWTLDNVSGSMTTGAMTARVPVCVYANGPAMYGVKIYGPLYDASTGTADTQERITINEEYWQNTGTPVTVRAVAGDDNSVYHPSGTSTTAKIASETFDLDWVNGGSPGGAGEIRGAAAGTTSYTHLTHKTPSVFWTLDPALSGPTGISGTADWLGLTPGAFNLATSEGWNSVQLAMTGTDLTFWHANHAHFPLTPGIAATPAVLDTTTTGTWGSGTNLGFYQPLGAPFIDQAVAYDTTGNHLFLAVDSTALAYLYYAWQQGASDHGMSWEQQLRVDALSGVGGQAIGLHEDATGHPLNIIYNWSPISAFTDPVRLYSAITVPGFDPQTTMTPGGQTTCCVAANDLTHFPSGYPGALYSLEGEEWQKDLLNLNAANAEMPNTDDYKRVATLGGTYYYGLPSDYLGNARAMGWAANGFEDAAFFGNQNEPNTIYHQETVSNWYTFRAAWFSYTGTFTSGINYPSPTNPTSATYTKGSSLVGNGLNTQPSDWFANVAAGQVNTGISSFENGYVAMADQKAYMQQNHAIGALDTLYSDFIVNQMIPVGAQNDCPYNLSSYGGAGGVIGPQTGPPATGTPYAGWDMTHPATAQAGNFPGTGGPVTFETYAGSTRVTAVAGPSGIPGGQTLATQITTSAPSSAGTTITVPSTTNVLAGAVINDITNSTGPFYVASVTPPNTITLDASTPTTGIGSGNVLFVSHLWTYPSTSTSAGDIYASGSIFFPTPSSADEGVNPQSPPTQFPVPTTPANSLLEGQGAVFCRATLGSGNIVSAGTLNPPGTSCGSPAPITFSANGAFNAGVVANNSCPPASAGTWNGSYDYHNPEGRVAEMFSTIRGDIALRGANGTNTAAETNFFLNLGSITANYPPFPSWAVDRGF